MFFCFSEGEDCEIQFAESVLLPAAESYRREWPDYDPNYDDIDDMIQFYIALDVSWKKSRNKYKTFFDGKNEFSVSFFDGKNYFYRTKRRIF